MMLKVNVFAYDYCGYGLSTGKATMANTLSDIEAAYQHLITNYASSTQNVIL